MIELRKINERDAYAQWEYTTSLPTDENGLTNPYHGVSYDDYIEKVLPTLISCEHPVNMPDWFVPETYWYLWDGETLVGEFRIRHRLTEVLRNGAGHIGYSIGKNFRGKGYGTVGLGLTVRIAEATVPEDEIYLRVNKDNIASQMVMLKNGAYKAGEDECHVFMRIPKRIRHIMKLAPEPFESIKSGKKTVEMRLYDEKRAKIAVGDTVLFENRDNREQIECSVTGLYRGASFAELYAHYGKIPLGYGENDIPNPDDMLKYYSPDDIKKYGTVGIEMKL